MRKDRDKDIRFQNNKDRDKFYCKMSDEQKELFSSIKSNIFTFCESCAGSGKTTVSVSAMLDMMANCEINKIVYIQKVSQRFLQNGFLPGTMEEKTDELWTPFYDAMITLGHQIEEVYRMTKLGLIVLTTDSNLRGINFEKAGIILDEAQNCDMETLKLIFTRCHDTCRVVMLGDIEQKDNKGRNNDFVLYGRYLAGSCVGNECKLTKNFRGKFSQIAESFHV